MTSSGEKDRNDRYTWMMERIVPKIRSLGQAEHWVYLLATPDLKNTYVGYSGISVERRLRQHNREISGGAKRTRQFPFWALMCALGRFPTANNAKRFEKAWQIYRKRKKQNKIAPWWTKTGLRSTRVTARLREMGSLLRCARMRSRLVQPPPTLCLRVWDERISDDMCTEITNPSETLLNVSFTRVATALPPPPASC